MTNFELIKSLNEEELAIFFSIDQKYANEWGEGIQEQLKFLREETSLTKEDFEDIKNMWPKIFKKKEEFDG